jgi:sugar lactone lactonase YvrE
MIGEFSPSTGSFVGQWPVTADTGPWDLTIANGQIWYTEHLASAVGRFDPATHTHQDFPTPSANSNPYGITTSGGVVWFTENNSGVDQVAVLDPGNGNAISEYPIVRPLSGTPHLIVVDAAGRPWWTEGFSNTIGTLDPGAATPGSCGTTSGTCTGIRRFEQPRSTTCGTSTHTSGIGFQASTNLVWLDNSLTAQVGSFNPSTGAFSMTTLSDCGAHPHDGLNLDSAGNVWFDEEFANAIGRLIPAGGSVNAGATSGSATAGATSGSATAGGTSESGGSAATSVGVPVPPAELGPIGPGVGQVRAALSNLLVPGKRLTIKKLLEKGGYSVSFGAPSAGTLTISWSAVAHRVRRSTSGTSRKRRRVVVAAAHRGFSAAGATKVTIRLAGAGKRLLKHVRTIGLTAKAAFAPTGEPSITLSKRFRLGAS